MHNSVETDQTVILIHEWTVLQCMAMVILKHAYSLNIFHKIMQAYIMSHSHEILSNTTYKMFNNQTDNHVSCHSINYPEHHRSTYRTHCTCNFEKTFCSVLQVRSVLTVLLAKSPTSLGGEIIVLNQNIRLSEYFVVIKFLAP